jgi:uncharacterized protein YwqG
MIDKRVSQVIWSVAREHDTPDEVVERVLAKVLPSIRLIPEPLTEEPPLGSCRIGGCPDLPKKLKWPRRSDAAGEDPEEWDPNDPFRFILQVNLAEVAPFDVAGVLPKSGLLSFFYYAIPDEFPGDVAYIIHTEPKNLRRLRWPGDLPDKRRYQPLALKPCLEWTVPSIEDSGFDADEVDVDFPHFDFFRAVGDRVAEVQGLTSPHDGSAIVHRLLGHPQLIHSPGLADGTKLLLQVDSDAPEFRGPGLPRTGMMWGDCGRIYYLTSDDELKAHQLAEKPWVLWEG